MPESAFYTGSVVHVRHRPRRHRLRLPVYFLVADLDELPALDARLRLFSHNRPNLFSLYDRDHGPRDGTALKRWVERHLRAAQLYDPGGRVLLLTFPRVLGYVFAPLSVYYCLDRHGRPVAILHEVRNTFGELHGYLLPVTGLHDHAIEQEAAKAFHVSPFIPMDAHYRFRLTLPGRRIRLSIREDFEGGRGLTAVLAGRRRPLTDATLLRAFLANPLMTFRVIAGIHWHALRLLLKGVPWRRRPAPPATGMTIGRG